MVPLFAAVFRGLGHDLYLNDARVSSAMVGDSEHGAEFHGCSHIILIVTINNRKYVVDLQYIEITELVLLDPSGPEVVFNGIPTTVVGLRYCKLAEVIPNSASNCGHMTWFFEHKRSQNDEWIPDYIFSSETEWFLEDLPIMNVWLAKADESYLVSQVINKRLLLEGEDDPNITIGNASLRAMCSDDGLLKSPEISGSVKLAGDTLRIFRYGKKVIEKKIKTEEERLELLRGWFGIVPTEAERKAIQES
jgi:arylamine N-acetyltransferase